MKSCFPTILILSAALGAQGSLLTATNYGDFANSGTGQVNGVPSRTTIGPRGLHISASDGTAMASTDVMVDPGRVPNSWVLNVGENGAAGVRTSGRAVAGTSSDHTTAMPGAHDLLWTIPGRPGTTATIMVAWQGAASANAMTSVAVDADGDGTADFAHRISNGRVQQGQSFNVTAGRGGSFDVLVSTSGTAAVGGAGLETYSGGLVVVFSPGGGGSPCTFTSFGRPCGGSLTGAAVSNAGSITAGIQLAGAAANAIAVLAVGDPLSTPVQLPGSVCSLLVNPRGVLAGRTDANGDAGWRLSFRPQAGLTVSFQAVTLDLSSGGAALASSDGLTMQCP